MSHEHMAGVDQSPAHKHFRHTGLSALDELVVLYLHGNTFVFCITASRPHTFRLTYVHRRTFTSILFLDARCVSQICLSMNYRCVNAHTTWPCPHSPHLSLARLCPTHRQKVHLSPQRQQPQRCVYILVRDRVVQKGKTLSFLPGSTHGCASIKVSFGSVGAWFSAPDLCVPKKTTATKLLVHTASTLTPLRDPDHRLTIAGGRELDVMVLCNDPTLTIVTPPFRHPTQWVEAEALWVGHCWKSNIDLISVVVVVVVVHQSNGKTKIEEDDEGGEIWWCGAGDGVH